MLSTKATGKVIVVVEAAVGVAEVVEAVVLEVVAVAVTEMIIIIEVVEVMIGVMEVAVEEIGDVPIQNVAIQISHGGISVTSAKV